MRLDNADRCHDMKPAGYVLILLQYTLPTRIMDEGFCVEGLLRTAWLVNPAFSRRRCNCVYQVPGGQSLMIFLQGPTVAHVISSLSYFRVHRGSDARMVSKTRVPWAGVVVDSMLEENSFLYDNY